jgi:hypothetical protein
MRYSARESRPVEEIGRLGACLTVTVSQHQPPDLRYVTFALRCSRRRLLQLNAAPIVLPNTTRPELTRNGRRNHISSV